MKWLCRFSLLVVFIVLAQGCANRPFLIENSSGILEWNRKTGQFEMLWEHAERSPQAKTDTVFVQCTCGGECNPNQ